MITTKYNFKQRMSKKYPNIVFMPVYGTSAYLFNKELNPIDMYEYNVTQLANGQYICFVGTTSTATIKGVIEAINKGEPLTGRRESPYAPTTFTTFESYIQRKGIQIIHRTHIQDQSANEALFTDKDDAAWNIKRCWYMYEVDVNVPLTLNPATPYVETENGTRVFLIKSSHNNYVSKKKLFMQKFTRMQPIYDQLIAACATKEWDKAQSLCEQYVSIQFDQIMTIKDMEQLKEAYEDGTLRLYTRNIENFEVASENEVL